MAEFQRRDRNFLTDSMENELTALTAPPFQRRQKRNFSTDSIENELTPLTAPQPLGDGKLPPSGRPPATEMELRRLMDHLADPAVFAAWFQLLMERDE